MGEIEANQCQNGDKQEGILIKKNVTIDSERSYITEVFHGQRMYLPDICPTGYNEQKRQKRCYQEGVFHGSSKQEARNTSSPGF